MGEFLAKAIVGTQWGDEGKGRMIDYFATNSDVVIRYQGGNNAGHTIVNEFGTFKLHLIPSGIFNKDAINILGPGMIIDIQALCEEIEELNKAGIDTSNIRISDRATIVFPYNRLEDELEEARLGKNAYGSTRKGISPAYGDRYMKKSIQVGELLYLDRLKDRLEKIVEWKNLSVTAVYKHEPISSSEMFEWAKKYGEILKPLICNTNEILVEAKKNGKKILFEAQLGALRDIYFGIYPFTSSSSVLAGFAGIGSGIFGYTDIETVGVMKAFSTCVGAGPFVTEIPEEEAKDLRDYAGEYGAATGRPRRIGHFDAVAARYGAEIQGSTCLALTKLDSLSREKSLKICTGYEVNGKLTEKFPINAELDIAKPVYIELPGWEEEISHVRDFSKLPKNAQDYVLKIEELMNIPITYVSVGPERDSLMTR